MVYGASQIGSLYVVSLGLDLTDSGWWGVGGLVGVLDGIKAILVQLSWRFTGWLGLSLAKSNLCAV